jgi:hypothetical protein
MIGIMYAAVLPDPVVLCQLFFQICLPTRVELTSLSNSHDVHALQHGRDGVRLDWGGLVVLSQLQVLKDDWMQASVGKLSDD